MPLFATPAHPEAPSGHSTVSGAAGGVLARFFGERKHFTVDNDRLERLQRRRKGEFVPPSLNLNVNP